VSDPICRPILLFRRSHASSAASKLANVSLVGSLTPLSARGLFSCAQPASLAMAAPYLCVIAACQRVCRRALLCEPLSSSPGFQQGDQQGADDDRIDHRILIFEQRGAYGQLAMPVILPPVL
jgi:hypothetical protein